MNFKIIFCNISLWTTIVSGLTCRYGSTCKTLPSTNNISSLITTTKTLSSSRTISSFTTTTKTLPTIINDPYAIILKDSNKCKEEEISYDVINRVKHHCESKYHGELLASFDYYIDGCYKNLSKGVCNFCINGELNKGNSCTVDEDNKNAFPSEAYNKCVEDGGYLLDNHGYVINTVNNIQHDYNKPVRCFFCAEGYKPYFYNYGFYCKKVNDLQDKYTKFKNLPFLSTSEIPLSPNNSTKLPVINTHHNEDTAFSNETMEKIKDYCENTLHGVAQLRFTISSNFVEYINCNFCNDENLKYDFYHNTCKPIGEDQETMEDENTNCIGDNEISISDYENFIKFCKSNSGVFHINYRRKTKNCYKGAIIKCTYPLFYQSVSILVSKPPKGVYPRTVLVENNKVKRAKTLPNIVNTTTTTNKTLPITKGKTLSNSHTNITAATVTGKTLSNVITTTSKTLPTNSKTLPNIITTTSKTLPTNSKIPPKITITTERQTRICRSEGNYGYCYYCENGIFKDPESLECYPDEKTKAKINLKKEECEAAGYYFVDNSYYGRSNYSCIQCGRNFRYDDKVKECVPKDIECPLENNNYGKEKCKLLGGSNDSDNCNLVSSCIIENNSSFPFMKINTTKTIPKEALTSTTTIATATTKTTKTTTATNTNTNTNTTISLKYCDPQTITITERETLTEEETITITIDEGGEITPTPKEPEEKCSGRYAQCGGTNYQGPTCCQSGSKCVFINEYYSQCL